MNLLENNIRQEINDLLNHQDYEHLIQLEAQKRANELI